MLPHRHGHRALLRRARRGGSRRALTGLLAISLVAGIGLAVPLAAGAKEGDTWTPSDWTGEVAGPPVPGTGLPAAAVPAIPVALPEGYDVVADLRGPGPVRPGGEGRHAAAGRPDQGDLRQHADGLDPAGLRRRRPERAQGGSRARLDDERARPAAARERGDLPGMAARARPVRHPLRQRHAARASCTSAGTTASGGATTPSAAGPSSRAASRRPARAVTPSATATTSTSR